MLRGRLRVSLESAPPSPRKATSLKWQTHTRISSHSAVALRIRLRSIAFEAQALVGTTASLRMTDVPCLPAGPWKRAAFARDERDLRKP